MTFHMHNPPQLIMSPPHLQPSPFSPTQFLTPSTTSHSLTHLDPSDEELSSFIKKRPLEVTEDLVEGRVETASQRLRRRASRRATLRGCHIPQLFAPTLGVVDPITPPNRPSSPMSFLSCDMTLTPASERPSHSPQPRRTPKNRRSTKVKRACTTASSTKSTRESSPVLVRSRSPLCLWTPPPPPPRCSPIPSYAFGPQSHLWTNNIQWTITSPSSSPYPSHSSPHQQA